jgi:hypothetical protein
MPVLSLTHTTCPVHPILLDFINQKILGEEYSSLSFSLSSFLHSRYLVPLRPKCSPQYPILKHPQPTFLPQYRILLIHSTITNTKWTSQLMALPDKTLICQWLSFPLVLV